MNPHRSILAALTSITVMVAAPSALAQAPLRNISSGNASSASRAPGIIGEAEGWIQAAMAGPTAASDSRSHSVTSATAERATVQESPAATAAAEKPVFDLAPSASLVARDWRGSMKLVGDRTMLVDDLRPTANTRMVVGRLSTAEARVTTFAHVGAGEWRVDTVMFPNARSYSETAGQVGGGFELRLPAQLRVSGEAQYTMLTRSMTYAADEVAPLITAFVFALDGKF